MKLSNYENQITKDGVIGELKLSDWEKLLRFMSSEKNSLNKCLFRGQSADFELKPSLYRIIDQSLEDEGFKKIYDKHIHNFKKYSRGRTNLNYEKPELEWWALGQHYGLSTPFLDWVKSPYVATFFSFLDETSTSDERVIFILDYEKIRSLQASQYGPEGDQLNDYESLTHENRRIVNQQGVFTFIAPISSFKYKSINKFLVDFAKRRKQYLEDECLLLKVKIPSKHRDIILNELDLMNINMATLFPELDGSAKHSNYLLNLKER